MVLSFRGGISFLLISLFLWSCNRPPQADYYNAEGIVSIHVSEAEGNEYWENYRNPPVFSLRSLDVSDNEPGELELQFYVQNAGSYALWILGASETGQNNPLQLRLLDENDEFISTHRVELNGESIPNWVNRDQFTDDPVVLNFAKEGFYKLQLESGGVGGLHVSKIHMSKNGDLIPNGTGYPETKDWRIDPVIDKRLEQSAIPPAWVFGSIVNQNQNIEMADALLIDQNDSGQNAFSPHFKLGRLSTESGPDFVYYSDYQPFEDLNVESRRSRGLNLYPAQNLLDSRYKDFPLPWYKPEITAGFDYMKEAVNILSNPDLATYESAWLVIPPEWYEPGNLNNIRPSDELILRTLQLSAFQNVMFTPAADDGFSDELLEELKNLIQLRQQLFPYIYSYTNRARTVGTKLITGYRDFPGQFLFGEYFLVAPVFEEGADNREVYLPEGVWYNFQTEEMFEGGQSFTVDVSMNSLPLFVKGGGIIPQRPDAKPILLGNNSKLLIDVYSGGSGSFRLYEDDGESLEYQSGEFSTIAYRYFEGEGYSTFNIGAMVNGFSDRRKQTDYEIRFKMVDEPTQITVNGNILDRTNESQGWNYDREKRTLFIYWNQMDSNRSEFRIEF
ncbi:DUF5110 domain-containing protein [Rhodohalobacter barkolensis]|uniref:Uncharacterized protein n=1 Tax=Rhodohalobacter barkolensis TaxID=2053187 RepID=A0A2N0VIZ1_9BACT|nr:DUF5110 domain-containing protein [Rhodohalobacter barkolensis]PKD44118.1 hypothetical protein CWD77_01205 [Rhodohalobacter barkolensis]